MTLELPALAPPRLFADGGGGPDGGDPDPSASASASASGVDDETARRLFRLLDSRLDVLDTWISERADVAAVQRLQAKARARLLVAQHQQPRAPTAAPEDDDGDGDGDGDDDVVCEIAPPRSRRSSSNSNVVLVVGCCPAGFGGSSGELRQQQQQQPPQLQRRPSGGGGGGVGGGQPQQQEQLLRPSAPPCRYDIYRSSFRGRNSLTSNLFRNWVTNPYPGKGNKAQPGKLRERLESMKEDEMFMELLKDIANELDIDVLCHKIMVNVGFLTKADRGSLFLAKGPLENRYLVTKLFDVTVDSELEDVLWPTQGAGSRVIPFGVGIAGHVAKTKESLNLKNAFLDPRFDPTIDQVTGYRTESLLCMPMCNYEGHVTGVAQIINKSNWETEFSARDEMLFRKYLTFCGIGIQNAQLFEMSVREFKRNQFLLNLAQQIFEEQNNLERLITKILREAGEMTSARQCCLYLLQGCMTVGPDDLLEDRNRASIEDDKPLFTKPEEVTFETIYSLATDRSASDDLGGVPCNIDVRRAVRHNSSSSNNNNNNNEGEGGNSKPLGTDDDNDDDLDDDSYWMCGLRILDPRTDFRDPRLCHLARAATINGEVSSEVLSEIEAEAPNDSRAIKPAAALTVEGSSGAVVGSERIRAPAFSSSPSPSGQHVGGNIPIVIEPADDESHHQQQQQQQRGRAYSPTTTATATATTRSDGGSGYTYPLQVLSVPVREGVQRRVVGVVQLIQKENVGACAFSDSDAALVEAVAIFCGLGVRNTKMYEGAMKLMAKQKVALECLSYHAAAAPEDTQKLVEASSATVPVPASAVVSAATATTIAPDPVLYRFDFNDFEMSDIETCLSVVKMFHALKLNSTFMIPHEVLCQWIMSVKKNYRPIKYHNWRHAINVAQTMFAVLTTGKLGQFMSDEEIFALLIACLSHDLDHRGTNNAFQAKSASPLAVLYTTSPMEHHHFDQCIMILNTAGSNILQAVSPEVYKKIIRHIESAILATDLATYFRKKVLFLDLVESGEWDWQEEDKKELLCGMLMTACDVAAISKPWEVQQKIARLVADEFFEQGDIERLQLNQEPIAMMDREKKDELPLMQVNFIDNICLPLYKALSDTFPWLKPLHDGCAENRNIWKKMAEQVEMGLTWINSTSLHDAISNVGTKIEPEKVYLIPRHSIRSTRSSQASLSVSSVDLERRRSSGLSSSSRSRKSSDMDMSHHHPPPAPAPTPTMLAPSFGSQLHHQQQQQQQQQEVARAQDEPPPKADPARQQHGRSDNTNGGGVRCPVLRVEDVDHDLQENDGGGAGGSNDDADRAHRHHRKKRDSFNKRKKAATSHPTGVGSPKNVHKAPKKAGRDPQQESPSSLPPGSGAVSSPTTAHLDVAAASRKEQQLQPHGRRQHQSTAAPDLEEEDETRKKSTSSNGSSVAAAAAQNAGPGGRSNNKAGKSKLTKKKEKICRIS